MAKKKKLTDKELLELGKKLQDFYETGYINKKQALLYSLMKGAAAGFGGVLGATIVVAILIWVLSLFGHIPFLDKFVEAVNNSLQSK